MVSVCMSSYNGEKYIREQIMSILAQLGASDELIISDDGSTDGTLAIIKDINDDRIVLTLNGDPHGVNFNFENAIKRAKGNYIFLSDQDDVWLPNKVVDCVYALQNADLVIHDCVVVDKDKKVIVPSYFKQYKSRRGYLKNIIKNTYIGACMVFRKEILEYVLPFPSNFPVYHDGWLGSMVELKGRVLFLPTNCILYRRHNSNLSFSATKSGVSFKRRIINRVMWLYLTMRRYLFGK